MTPMGNEEFFKAEIIRNEEQVPSLLMATGSSYRCFHQDLDPPLDAVNTVEAGRKLWLFTPPGSRITALLTRVASAMKPEDVLKLIQCKIEGAKISAVKQNSGTSIFVPWEWGHSVVTN